MNLVGKIFTVLIFVLSLVFMTLAVMVYATHKNYRTVVLNPRDKANIQNPIGLKWQLEDARTENSRLKEEKDKIERDFTEEKAAKIDALTKLENELTELKEERVQREREKATLTEDWRRATAAMKAAQDESNKFGEEAKTLRLDLETARKDRRLHEQEVNRLTDEAHQLKNDLRLLKDRSTILSADLAKAQTVLRHFGMNLDTDISGSPPPVDGIVEAVQGGGLVEVNLGTDDGLMKGHRLEVVRVGPAGSKYVGRVEVVHVAADRAVCRIIPQFQKSDVQVDDRVYSRLQ
ncbi:MAG: hypothetical protein JXB10_14285 [Pirellulales bacterium]|nr:hypothetical protein [Pirellulales bacterium]